MKALTLILFSILLLFSGTILQAQEFEEIQIDDDIQLLPLGDSIYIHISWSEIETYGRIPSNGLLLIRQGKVLMVDTPMDEEITARLVNYLEDSMRLSIHTMIPGHFHDDCLGGLEYLHSRGVHSIANQQTIDSCRARNKTVPRQAFRDSLVFSFFGEWVHCRHFGGGHTPDNIVIWLPNRRLLFGGCLIRAMKARSMGNVADAVPLEWGRTSSRILQAYSDIKLVIPGHADYGGSELIEHTIRLADHYNSQRQEKE